MKKYRVYFRFNGIDYVKDFWIEQPNPRNFHELILETDIAKEISEKYRSGIQCIIYSWSLIEGE